MERVHSDHLTTTTTTTTTGRYITNRCLNNFRNQQQCRPQVFESISSKETGIFLSWKYNVYLNVIDLFRFSFWKINARFAAFITTGSAQFNISAKNLLISHRTGFELLPRIGERERERERKKTLRRWEPKITSKLNSSPSTDSQSKNGAASGRRRELNSWWWGTDRCRF